MRPKIWQRKSTIKKFGARGFTHMAFLLAFIAVFVVLGVGYVVISHAAGPAMMVDVGQPQCGWRIGHYPLGIVGVNSVRGIWTGNPCLHAEATHFNAYALYILPNWPSGACRARHLNDPYACGKNAAVNAINYAASQHVNIHARWWIDTETGAGWGRSVGQNRRMLEGVSDALRARTHAVVGYYSSPSEWGHITGNWRNSQPFWLAEGGNAGIKVGKAKSLAGRITRTWCPHRVSGPNYLVQVTGGVTGISPNGRVDVSFTCH